MHDEDTADLTKDANSLVDMSVQVGNSRHQLLTAGVCGKTRCLLSNRIEKTEKLSSFHSFFFFFMMVFQVPRRWSSFIGMVNRVNRKIVYRVDQDVYRIVLGRRSKVEVHLPDLCAFCLIITLNCSVACAYACYQRSSTVIGI